VHGGHYLETFHSTPKPQYDILVKVGLHQTYADNQNKVPLQSNSVLLLNCMSICRDQRGEGSRLLASFFDLRFWGNLIVSYSPPLLTSVTYMISAPTWKRGYFSLSWRSSFQLFQVRLLLATIWNMQTVLSGYRWKRIAVSEPCQKSLNSSLIK